MKNVCEISSGDFFTQKLKVGNIDSHSWKYCEDLCRDKKVLHIGCSDWPIFNAKCNMHIHLGEFCKMLHGCDPNGTEELKKHFDGAYFQHISEVNTEYDVILVPNIIEHLRNPGRMVNDLFKINFKKMFVLVPNYKVYEQATYENGIFTERIHIDHFCWYSPYTLWNLFKSHIEANRCECEMNFFDDKNMISILITKN